MEEKKERSLPFQAPFVPSRAVFSNKKWHYHFRSALFLNITQFYITKRPNSFIPTDNHIIPRY